VWRDHWYPVSLVEDLDPRVPTPFQLLNRDLVIWKDPKAGEWVALDDRCPHRLAPLSVRSRLLSSPHSVYPYNLYPQRRSARFCVRRRGGSTRRGACSAPTTAGPSTAPAPAPRSSRPRRRGSRPGRCARPGLAPPSSPRYCRRGCSSCGPTRMGGRRPRPPSLQCTGVKCLEPVLWLFPLNSSVERKLHFLMFVWFQAAKRVR
jgi:nitrite reductase/ring-hydroxylating ferredoxin subunit